MARPGRPFARWLAWELGCLGEFVFWWFVLPAALAFLALVLFSGDLIVVSRWLHVVVILLFVVAPLVVLFTATFGYLRAKTIAAEREWAEERDVEAGAPSSTAER